MKKWEIRELKAEEVKRLIEEESAKLNDLRFTHALKQLDNTALLGNTRRKIARLKSALNSFENKKSN